jgi:hypothetical protein
MKNLFIPLPLILFILLLFCGCTNEQTGEPVSFSEILFGVNDSVKNFQDSEVHNLLPSDVKGIVAIISIGIAALGNVLLALQNTEQKKTLTEIVFENPELSVKSTKTNLAVSKIRKKLSP